jgi:hypothetical protein
MFDSLPITKRGFREVAPEGSLYECKASPGLVAAFESRAIKVLCSENDVLFSNGEPGKCVYLVLAGEVALFLPLTPMDGMGFRAQSGCFLGLPAAFSNEHYSMTAVARKGAEVDRFFPQRRADSENNLGASSRHMYYIGLDVHKKTISYCVKDAAGCVYQEGKIGSTRAELDAWIKTLPRPRMMAMEATMFTDGSRC